MPRPFVTEYDFSNRPLGYVRPPDNRHIELYPIRRGDVNPLAKLQRPKLVVWPGGVRYDQGNEGACVGYSISGWCSAWDYKQKQYTWYDAHWLYREAQKADEWPGEAYSGTSVRAGLDVARHRGVPQRDNAQRLFLTEYRWATQTEDLLDHIAFVGPIVCGMDWYGDFDKPKRGTINGKSVYQIGVNDLGRRRGGHSIMASGYCRDDEGKEWIRFQNSWGYRYPLVWMPRSTIDRLWFDRAIEMAMIIGEPVRV